MTTVDAVPDDINIAPVPVRAPAPTRRVLTFLMRNALPVGFVSLIVLFVLLQAPNFLTPGNASDILRLSAPIMVVAIPMAFLLIMGHVDLSVGSGVSLAAVVAAVLIVHVGVSPVVACLLAVATLAGVGLVNGLLVTRLGLSPIIVTLGSLTALRGIGMLVAPDPVYGLGNAFSEISYTGIFGIPYLVIGAAVVVVIGALSWHGPPSVVMSLRSASTRRRPSCRGSAPDGLCSPHISRPRWPPGSLGLCTRCSSTALPRARSASASSLTS